MNRNKVKEKTLLQLHYYIEAMKSGDILALEKLLSEDVVLAADGGETVKVIRELTVGIVKSSKLLLYVYKAFLTNQVSKTTYINHQPAILFYKNGEVYNCQVFEFEETRIKNIYSIVDPEKLKLFSF